MDEPLTQTNLQSCQKAQTHSLSLVVFSIGLVFLSILWLSFFDGSFLAQGQFYSEIYLASPDINIPVSTAILLKGWMLAVPCMAALALAPTFIASWLYFTVGREDFYSIMILLVCEAFSVLLFVLLQLGTTFVISRPLELANPF